MAVLLERSPAGALTEKQLERLKDTSGVKVFLVACSLLGQQKPWDIVEGDVSRFNLMLRHPDYYFLNYWLAYGYSLRMKNSEGNHG